MKSGKFFLVDTGTGAEEGIVTVTLNRPDIHNAFNDEFISELTSFFKEVSNHNETRLLILTGAGKSFCAGADLNWMKRMKDYSDEENYRDSLALAGLFESLNQVAFPVIGVVNGACLGGGTGLVAACDYVMASDSALFGFTEVGLGLIPAVISPFVIAKIGESNARAYFLSGERFDAEKAKELGLIHEVSGDLEAILAEKKKRFLKAGPEAARAAKELIKGVMSCTQREEARDYTCKMIAKIRVGNEGQEGMTALLEKRKPHWIK